MGTLWYNGKIYTMENEGHRVEAVLTVDGQILAVGKKHDLMERYKSYIDEEIDLKNKTMLPGFQDSHMHLIGFGESLLRMDLSNIRSKGELLHAVKMKKEELGDGEWIIGEGWNENLWEERVIPTKEELDEVAPSNPVLLKRTCRHVCLVNSKTLRLARVSEDTANPEGGIIDRDENGKLTGLLKDAAMNLVANVVPPYTLETIKRSLRKGIQECYKLGITGAHTEDLSYYGSFTNTYKAFQEVIEKEDLYFRAHLLIHHEVIDEWAQLGVDYLSGTPFITFGPMKIFADGSLGGRTALLSFLYADDTSTNGVNVHSYEKFQALVKKARSLNLPVAVHAIGDLAFEWLLDAIEKYPVNVGRDRLIHAQLLRKDLVERMKKLPVVVDIQPRFLHSDFPWVFERIGHGPIDYLYAWKTLINEGIHCAGGSDAPIEPADPLLGIHAAVLRTIPDDENQQVYIPEERLSMYEAVSLFTKGSAYAALEERKFGMIKEDFAADFTILDQDLFEIDPKDILNTRVEITVVNGKIMYERKS